MSQAGQQRSFIADDNSVYRSKLITIDDAIGMIKSGDTICAAQCASAPVGLLGALHKIKGRVKDVTLWHSIEFRTYPFFTEPDMSESLIYEAWFYGPAERNLHPTGRVTHQPCHLSQVVEKKLARRSPNVFWGTATRPDKHGNLSLSVGVVYEREVLEKADCVILEINENLPRVFGDTIVNVRDVDYFVENTCPLLELTAEEPGPEDRAIGNSIAELVEDGSTLQLGIGRIPNAVALSLFEKKDLGVHSEMLTDSMVDLYRAGVITNKKKTLCPNKFIGSFALGTKKLYEFIDDNPTVELRVGRWANDPYIIGQNHRMVSINSCLQVDLTGQVCSESIGSRQISGTGGQWDTAAGAQRSPEGKSFVTMHSSAKNGTISTIVPYLDLGAVVTLHRNDVDHVVTEYGVAPLKGRNIRERVGNLIAIAHPKFRDQLKDKARDLKLW